MSASFMVAIVMAFRGGGDDPMRDCLPPVCLEAAGQAIDTEVGHAAPFVGEFDGGGTNDLLAGQFGDGIHWFYRNLGTNAKPSLAAGVQFRDGKKDGRVPTG